MANIPALPTSTGFVVSWSPYLVPVFLGYVGLCSLLRFQRRDAMKKKFNFPDRASFARMTTVEAQEITQYLAELEFPKLYELSLQFALFKTYGISTISSLLVSTKELASAENSSKRYADTVVLIQEFASNHPRDERSIKSLARMNYIHSLYIKAGKISNEDLLYTLTVFITEPITWTEKYEWRTFTDMEKCALATGWKSIGDAMGIRYGGYLPHSEWKDGLEFYEDIKTWAEWYEKKYMVPAVSNKKTADELVPLLLFYVPGFLKAAAAQMVGVMMGDRLRTSMMYPTPPNIYFRIVNAVFSTRRFILRYLSLPRPSFMNVRQLTDPDPKTGRFYMSTYRAHPFYNKPTFLNRWGPEGWFVWAMGGQVPGSDKKFQPEGYVFQEVGPKGLRNKGAKEVEAWEEKLRAERPAGCPFAFSR